MLFTRLYHTNCVSDDQLGPILMPKTSTKFKILPVVFSFFLWLYGINYISSQFIHLAMYQVKPHHSPHTETIYTVTKTQTPSLLWFFYTNLILASTKPFIFKCPIRTLIIVPSIHTENPREGITSHITQTIKHKIFVK